MKTVHRRLIIMGSGPAGCTAGIYAARAGLNPLIIHGIQPGGQLTVTTDVENYPGFANAVLGPDLMDAMQEQAKNNGADTEYLHIAGADLSQRPFTLTGDDRTYTCDALIVSTGASAKWLGIPSEREFLGYGVSSCATCDGFFFKKQPVCVVGGGNTALEEALYLSNICSIVYLIHRRDQFRGEKILRERVFKNNTIKIIWNNALHKITGEEKPKQVTGAVIKNNDGIMRTLNVNGVFVAIGHTPNTDIFRGRLDMDAAGYITTMNGSTVTSIPGVFAAGDVQDKVYKQAVTAAGTGCMAAIDCEKFLSAST